jgi:ketosteroid isomerase-like protein
MDEAARAGLVGEIRDMVDRETRAWDMKDAETLVAIFHPDMVWPWPPDSRSHDPMTWLFVQGRYHRARWRDAWQELFDTHDLVRNERKTLRVEVSREGDGAFAVVDVDTLWRHKVTGESFHWKGRACKGYTKTADGWKLIMHTGLLEYGSDAAAPGADA